MDSQKSMGYSDEVVMADNTVFIAMTQLDEYIATFSTIEKALAWKNRHYQNDPDVVIKQIIVDYYQV